MAVDDPYEQQEGESSENYAARLRQSISELSQAASTAGEVLKIVTNNISLTGLAMDQFQQAIETGALKAADKVIDLYRQSVLRLEDLSSATVEVQAMLQSVTGLNAVALERTEFGVDTVAQKLSKQAYQSVQDLSAAQVQMVDGTKLSAVAFIKSAEDLSRDFVNVVLDDQRLFNAGVEGMSFELQKNVKFSMDALRLQSDELNEIFQIELSTTGKISGQMLDEFNKTVMAAAKVSGQVPQVIAQDVAKMMKDFSHFGAMTKEQMASLSTTIHQLGISISDVTSLADQFSNFDRAAETMSKLAATTGATLDTLELFQLANEDQEAFIEELRSQLESQGVEFENMNIIQQKQIASAFGVDPRIMQRLLNDNFSAIESISGEIEERASKMSKTEVDSMIASMNSMAEQAKNLTATEIQSRISSMQIASADYAKTIEHSYRTTVGIVQQVVNDMGTSRDAAIQAATNLRQQLQGMNDEIDKMLRKTEPDSRAGSSAPRRPPAPVLPVETSATANANAIAVAAQEAAATGTAPAMPPPPPPPPAATPPPPPPPPPPPSPTPAPPAEPVTSAAPAAASPPPAAPVVAPVTLEETKAAEEAGREGSVQVVQRPATSAPSPSAPPAQPTAEAGTPGTGTPASPSASPQSSPSTPTTQTVNVVFTFQGTEEFTNVLAKNILTKGANGVQLDLPAEGGELKLVFSQAESAAPVLLGP